MPKSRIKQLGLFYLIALGCIAISIIVSQILIQTSINRQQDDAHVINVAGRQRMLSQKISKLALKTESRRGDPNKLLKDLSASLALWKASHEGLKHGNEELGYNRVNSDTIRAMFAAIEPHFQAVYQNAEQLLKNVNAPLDHSSYVNAILLHEPSFLEGMDRIVFQYDFEAQQKVKGLKTTETYLFALSLIIILVELIFVFRPIAKNVQETVLELVKKEETSKKMANELSKLYEELGRSYQDLEAVNIHPASPSLFATMDFTGRFRYISPAFLHLLEYEKEQWPPFFQKLLFENGYKSDFIGGLMDMLKGQKNWNGELKLTTGFGDFCWLQLFMVTIGATKEIKLIGQDITELKEAKTRSQEITRERIEQSLKEQQFRSALILEGQEEERKRLARELHDGVGQMLSAMKLLLESLPPASPSMQPRLNDARGLVKGIILEVRRVSFNLTPSSLDDFGLVPAVKKFCQEINSVTDTEVTFLNETRFTYRLDSRIETNLYRIIQESVNNALKYAKASDITIRFSHTIHLLKIEVIDNGKGFDLERVESSGHFEKSGHGIFNIKERTAYIGGVFNLATSVGKGTNVTVTLPLEKND